MSVLNLSTLFWLLACNFFALGQVRSPLSTPSIESMIMLTHKGLWSLILSIPPSHPPFAIMIDSDANIPSMGLDPLLCVLGACPG